MPYNYQASNPLHVDYLFLRFADVEEQLADACNLRPDLSNYWLDKREILWMPAGRPPIKVGRLSYRHGGEHLHLPGEYWRTDDPWRFLGDLIYYLNSYLAPSALTVARVDWTTILDPFKHNLRDVAMSCFAQWPTDECGAATVAHQGNEYGETYYIGKRGRDPTKIRKRDCLVRVYDRLDRIPRQLRVEYECKGIETGDALPSYNHQLTWSHLHAQAHIGHLLTDHAPGPPTLVAAAGTTSRVDRHQTFKRAAGMLIGFHERNRQPLPRLFTAQLIQLGLTYRVNNAYLEALRQRCNRIEQTPPQTSLLGDTPLNLTTPAK